MARRIGSDGTRTRGAIRAAATRLIARRGYDGLSMRRLADEIGLQAAAIYRYYPNKQAILFSLMEAHAVEMLEAWRAARAGGAAGGPPGNPAARLEAFTRFHIRHHWSRIDGLSVSDLELRSLSPENFAKIDALRNRYEREVVAILQAGVASGAFVRMDARVAARAILALLNGLTTWYRPDGPIGRPEIEDMYWGMVARLVGIGADTGAAAGRLQPA
jgi:AcrR family transcriptional regulator